MHIMNNILQNKQNDADLEQQEVGNEGKNIEKESEKKSFRLTLINELSL